MTFQLFEPGSEKTNSYMATTALPSLLVEVKLEDFEDFDVVVGILDNSRPHRGYVSGRCSSHGRGCYEN